MGETQEMRREREEERGSTFSRRKHAEQKKANDVVTCFSRYLVSNLDGILCLGIPRHEKTQRSRRSLNKIQPSFLHVEAFQASQVSRSRWWQVFQVEPTLVSFWIGTTSWLFRRRLTTSILLTGFYLSFYFLLSL